MTKKYLWDLPHMLILFGGILGIIFSLLRVMNVWQLFPGVITADWTTTIIEIIIYIILIIAYIIVGLDIGNRFSTFLSLGLGILVLVLFVNLVGILFIISAIIVAIAGE